MAPAFFPQSILEDTKFIFQTKEATTFIFSGTGTGGWEAALTNTLSPGDKVRLGQAWGELGNKACFDV